MPELAEAEDRRKRALAVLLSSARRPSIGPLTAHVTISVFADFQCPYCGRLTTLLRTKIMPQFGTDTRIIFHQMPIEGHAWSSLAAVRTNCVFEQDNQLFWLIHDFLFQKQGVLNVNNLDATMEKELTTLHGFDMRAYRSCIASGNGKADILAEDLALADSLNVRATPTMFINNLKLEGSPPLEQLQSVIREVRAAVDQ